jgi:hypothetical protein
MILRLNPKAGGSQGRCAPTKDRPYTSTVEIEQVCAEALAKSGPKSCRTST